MPNKIPTDLVCGKYIVILGQVENIQLFSLFLFPNMRPLPKKYQESVSNFIEKTYNILENEQNSQIVGWTVKGTSFIIRDVKKFQEHILPTYFKHSNFSSFVRQLNMYNFHKVRGDKLDCEFEHEKFKKGQTELLCKIKRKQSESFIVSQNVIDDNLGNQSMQESSQNVKKYSEVIINSDGLSKEPGKQENNDGNERVYEELQNLKKENRNLKAIKQGKVQKQKMLNINNSSVMGEKFFKLITCLLAQKIQKELRIDRNIKIQEQMREQREMNFDQIIEHVLSNTQSPLQFSKYSTTAKTISSQQSDYDFMIRKANTSTQSVPASHDSL